MSMNNAVQHSDDQYTQFVETLESLHDFASEGKLPEGFDSWLEFQNFLKDTLYTLSETMLECSYQRTTTSAPTLRIVSRK